MYFLITPMEPTDYPSASEVTLNSVAAIHRYSETCL